ncbi:MAG: ERCC4 domain-containing protein, partial [Chloroflexota bacterium]
SRHSRPDPGDKDRVLGPGELRESKEMAGARHSTGSTGLWILQRCANDRFPFRLEVVRQGVPWLVLRTQDRWPGANKNIFCLREEELPEPDEVLEELERVPIVALHQRGPRLSVVLDRKRCKRCDFLFLTKNYKRQPGKTYEQIFWVTEKSLRQRRPSRKLSLGRGGGDFRVRVSSNERYPWRFPGIATERGHLPVGDYALVEGGDVLAVVERKTMDNLLAEFGTMQALHEQVAELTGHEQHALVVEAPYEDFLNPKKVHHYDGAFCAKALAELYALHPRLRLVFCANRKMANEWTRRYFAAVWERWLESQATHPWPAA